MTKTSDANTEDNEDDEDEVGGSIADDATIDTEKLKAFNVRVLSMFHFWVVNKIPVFFLRYC